jgi:hypothetical protein
MKKFITLVIITILTYQAVIYECNRLNVWLIGGLLLMRHNYTQWVITNANTLIIHCDEF